MLQLEYKGLELDLKKILPVLADDGVSAAGDVRMVSIGDGGHAEADFSVNVPAATYPHGWREVRLEDANGYMFAVGVATTT